MCQSIHMRNRLCSRQVFICQSLHRQNRLLATARSRKNTKLGRVTHMLVMFSQGGQISFQLVYGIIPAGQLLLQACKLCCQGCLPGALTCLRLQASLCILHIQWEYSNTAQHKSDMSLPLCVNTQREGYRPAQRDTGMSSLPLCVCTKQQRQQFQSECASIMGALQMPKTPVHTVHAWHLELFTGGLNQPG